MAERHQRAIERREMLPLPCACIDNADMAWHALLQGATSSNAVTSQGGAGGRENGPGLPTFFLWRGRQTGGCSRRCCRAAALLV